ENVLDLPGAGSYVELPPRLFTNQVVTVEGWIKWRELGVYSRFFQFADAALQIGLMNFANTATLQFERYRGPDFDDLVVVRVTDLLRTNQWFHFAAAVGTNWTKLYLNGVLITTNEAPLGWKPNPSPPLKNFLGRSVMKGNSNAAADTELNGQMDEVRIWLAERTEAQIRENLFKTLTGNEPGLAALWNFNDGTAKDSSTNGRHGTLVGNAKVIKARRPASSQLNLPSVVLGKVTDGSGTPVDNAAIRLMREEQAISTTTSRQDGTYFLVLRPEQAEGMFDVEASAGDQGGWVLGVTCPRGGRKEVNVTLSNAVSILGKVTAFDGSPIPDVIVQAVRADAPARAPGSLSTPGLVATTLTTATNAAQSYRFLNLRPGEYKVRIHVPDAQLVYHQGEVLRVEPGKTMDADFQIAPFRKGRWRRYSTANGLPSNRVMDLHFASDGTLWLATQNGVSHFDGLKFVSVSERNGLIDNRVFCIHAEKGGALWFGTEKGASRFNPASGRFQNFPGGTNGLTAGRVFDIDATPDGILWFRTREGLSRFDGKAFQEIPGIPRISQDPQRNKSKALAVDRQGRVWTLTERAGLWRVEGTNAVEVAEVSRDANQDALYVAPDGAIWFQHAASGDFGGIAQYDDQRFERLRAVESAINADVTAIHKTPEGIIWLGDLAGGVTRFDPVRFTFTRFGGGKDAPPFWVLKIQSGPDGALWFATAGGLYRYEEETFVNYGKADGLPGDSVFLSTATADGSLWFGNINNDPFLVRLPAGRTNRWENRFVN
ncbi:MAG TPA: LamG-like jellyroll fold domain-containing protein, partial [Candidatus Eisenbacteria bacterium]|nr:LamG-like jellyroll fold domain-containing protein [Candidatus Eisenbacteria bacterium]